MNILISHLSLLDLDSAGGLNKAGPLYALLAKKEYTHVYILHERQDQSVVSDADRIVHSWMPKKGFLDNIQGVKRAGPSIKVQSIEFEEIGELTTALSQLKGHFDDIAGRHPDGRVAIHASSKRPQTQCAWIALVCSQRITADCVQVLPSSRSGSEEAIISELSLPSAPLDEMPLRVAANQELSRSIRIAAACEALKIIGSDKVFVDLLYDAYRWSEIKDMHLLLSGPVGVGKETVARFVHRLCDEREMPFVLLDCSAPSHMLERQLFGDTAGDTGCSYYKAKGGILFLKKINLMNSELQLKLVSQLKRDHGGKARVIGSLSFDHKNTLIEELEEDLLRVFGASLSVPALSDRKGDIRDLAHYFLDCFNVRRNRSVTFAKSAIMALAECEWPRGVVELQHVVTSSALFLKGDNLKVGDLKFDDVSRITRLDADLPPLEDGFDLKGHVEELKRDVILRAIKQAHENLSLAGRLVGMERQEIAQFLKTRGLLKKRGSLKLRSLLKP